MGLAKPILWLIALVVLFLALFALSGNLAFRSIVGESARPQPKVDQNGVRVALARPAPTPADYIAAQNPHGFQALISYTDAGFEPRETSIKAGDTIRFTNNSTGQMWVAATGPGALYPGVQNGCGSSALDSCRGLKPAGYWEFTFDKKGTWDFVNNLDKSKIGIVHVK